MRVTEEIIAQRVQRVNKCLQLSYKPTLSYHIEEKNLYSLYYNSSPLIKGTINEIYYYLLGIGFGANEIL